MTLKIPDEGEVKILDDIRQLWNGGSGLCDLRLYKSAHTFSPGDVLADLESIEADFDGYALIHLQSWGAAVGPDVNDRAVTVETLRNFIVTGLTNLPQTIHGYFLADTFNGVLLAV